MGKTSGFSKASARLSFAADPEAAWMAFLAASARHLFLANYVTTVVDTGTPQAGIRISPGV
jgi:hypothetical protein